MNPAELNMLIRERNKTMSKSLREKFEAEALNPRWDSDTPVVRQAFRERLAEIAEQHYASAQPAEMTVKSLYDKFDGARFDDIDSHAPSMFIPEILAMIDDHLNEILTGETARKAGALPECVALRHDIERDLSNAPASAEVAEQPPKVEASDDDMARIGHSLMNAIAANSDHELMRGWTWAEDPAEIVCDLLNAYDEKVCAGPRSADVYDAWIKADKSGSKKDIFAEGFRAGRTSAPPPAPVYDEASLQGLLQIALDELEAVVAATDFQHETKKPPLKYTAPWAAIDGARKTWRMLTHARAKLGTVQADPEHERLRDALIEDVKAAGYTRFSKLLDALTAYEAKGARE